MNETKVRINKFVELIVQIPEETDIATFDGITEMVRKVNRAVGTILPTKRKYNVSGSKGGFWTEEKAKEFLEDSYKLTSEEVVDKYKITTADPKGYVSKTRTYLKTKFGLNNVR